MIHNADLDELEQDMTNAMDDTSNINSVNHTCVNNFPSSEDEEEPLVRLAAKTNDLTSQNDQ